MSLARAWGRWRCRRASEKAAARAEAFWSWFEGVAESAREMLSHDPSPGSPSPRLGTWVDELNRRTMAYHPLVRAVVQHSIEEPELVFTPDGDPAGIEPVRALTQSAPPVPGWRIRAFKPRLDVAGCACRVGASTLTADDVEFAVIDLDNPDAGSFTLLVLFVPGLAGPQAADVRRATDQLLQWVFGEERALRWMEYSVTYDSQQVLPEKLEGIRRTPLPLIAGLLENLDRQIGPRAVN